MKSTKNTILTLILMAVFNFGLLNAQEVSRPQSEDYIQGVTALNSGDLEKAYNCLNREIENNPENGYAHCYMSLICNACNDIVLAMQAANSSLELIPENDTEYRSFAYYTRGMLCANLKKWDNAISDLNESIKLCPQDAESYKARAELYLHDGKYENALDDLDRAIKLNSKMDITDIMLELMEVVPTAELAQRVTDTLNMMSL